MALDAASLALIAGQLKETLMDCRIDKIHQPSRDEVLLHMRARKGAHRLLLSARLGSARVCLTAEGYENPAAPPSFCMLLRKYLIGGRLVDVRPVIGDRIVFFDFLCTDEMGELANISLAAELMGRYCNLVLLRGAPLAQQQDCKVIDALKRIHFEDSDIRQLLPGLVYTLPPKQDKLEFTKAAPEEILKAAEKLELPVQKAVFAALGGVGPVVAREVCHRAGLGAQNLALAKLGQEAKEKLLFALNQVKKDWAEGGVPNIVQNEDGQPVEFGFTPLTQYLPQCKLKHYSNFSVLLEDYYAEKDRRERSAQKSKDLRRAVQNMYQRAQRKEAARQEELAAGENSDILRITGEVLTANLHTFKKGDALVCLQNWGSGKEMEIALDARLSPSQNAQKYFKAYKKKQTAAKMLVQLLESAKREIAYLATVLYEIDEAQNEAALQEIRIELKAEGYLKYFKQRDKRQKPADFLRYTSSDGFIILVGRNNLQNEKISLKIARGKDLWFHIKNAPGSHVVVISGAQDIPLKTQNQAAMLAVWHSSQKNGEKVPVDYTQAKNVRKTGDLPPGMVLYQNYETAYVTVNAQEMESFFAQQSCMGKESEE